MIHVTNPPLERRRRSLARNTPNLAQKKTTDIREKRNHPRNTTIPTPTIAGASPRRAPRDTARVRVRNPTEDQESQRPKNITTRIQMVEENHTRWRSGHHAGRTHQKPNPNVFERRARKRKSTTNPTLRRAHQSIDTAMRQNRPRRSRQRSTLRMKISDNRFSLRLPNTSTLSQANIRRLFRLYLLRHDT